MQDSHGAFWLTLGSTTCGYIDAGMTVAVGFSAVQHAAVQCSRDAIGLSRASRKQRLPVWTFDSFLSFCAMQKCRLTGSSPCSQSSAPLQA